MRVSMPLPGPQEQTIPHIHLLGAAILPNLWDSSSTQLGVPGMFLLCSPNPTVMGDWYQL